VELLVVLAIILVLISVLLPALNRAREQATLVQCESNLRQWGQTAYNFAVDHRGRFPEAWGSHGASSQGFYLAVPNTLTGDDLPDPADIGGATFGSWLQGGTSWNTFKQYGLTWQVANCPSTDACTAATETTPYTKDPYYVGDEIPPRYPNTWGQAIYHFNYLYVGGLATYLNQPNAYYVGAANWGTRIPAGKTCEDDLCDKVLACDAVVNFDNWQLPMMVNHPLPGNPGRAKFLNILYGDGHVAHDPSPTSVAVGPNAFSVSAIGGAGPFYYWGQ
jgi:prepilin-type processing-associated H-X9-DG protein